MGAEKWGRSPLVWTDEDVCPYKFSYHTGFDTPSFSFRPGLDRTPGCARGRDTESRQQNPERGIISCRCKTPGHGSVLFEADSGDSTLGFCLYEHCQLAADSCPSVGLKIPHKRQKSIKGNSQDLPIQESGTRRTKEKLKSNETLKIIRIFPLKKKTFFIRLAYKSQFFSNFVLDNHCYIYCN